MLTLGMRCTVWAFAREPYRRLHDSASKDKSCERRSSVFLDALNLCFNTRGLGWNWSQDLFVFPENRPVRSVQAFTTHVAASAILHFILLDFLHYRVQAFSPGTFGLYNGTIFDPELPTLRRFVHAAHISWYSGVVIYSSMQAVYDLCTVVGILILRQSPQDWPPFFWQPWKSSSLSAFWKRWHQTFREFFVGLGGYPMWLLFGRVGGVLGTFTVSGILHLVGLWGMGRGINMWDVFGMVGFFVMMGFGILLEGLYKRITGKRVAGWLGRIWTLIWLEVWATFLVDAWARRGLISSQFFPDPYRPAYLVFGPLA
ncbi:hypothetical protein D9758_004039 [Tetrapyrgos nigripes]|uniref:Wax synthase domain-containing protein n=1 Tax=Tetrapyrgos nigripes TaxID=182062 RepID=A0A8H5LR86_9AGAR|nr:hypothetical protein D9758_004039 [Tetrapyrgos nigripes]